MPINGVALVERRGLPSPKLFLLGRNNPSLPCKLVFLIYKENKFCDLARKFDRLCFSNFAKIASLTGERSVKFASLFNPAKLILLP